MLTSSLEHFVAVTTSYARLLPANQRPAQGDAADVNNEGRIDVCAERNQNQRLDGDRGAETGLDLGVHFMV